MGAGNQEILALEPAQFHEASPLRTMDELVSTFEGDVDFVKELAAIFMERAPALAGELRLLLGTGDGLAVSRVAHTLKGMVGYFGRGAAYSAAALIEVAAKSDVAFAAAAMGSLSRGLEDLRLHLEKEVLHG